MRVDLESIVEHLSHEVTRALEQTVKTEVKDDGRFNSNSLFRTFARNIGRQCAKFENVPDSCVKTE